MGQQAVLAVQAAGCAWPACSHPGRPAANATAMLPPAYSPCMPPPTRRSCRRRPLQQPPQRPGAHVRGGACPGGGLQGTAISQPRAAAPPQLQPQRCLFLRGCPPGKGRGGGGLSTHLAGATGHGCCPAAQRARPRPSGAREAGRWRAAGGWRHEDPHGGPAAGRHGGPRVRHHRHREGAERGWAPGWGPGWGPAVCGRGAWAGPRRCLRCLVPGVGHGRGAGGGGRRALQVLGPGATRPRVWAAGRTA
jgi:hypothetical protein